MAKRLLRDEIARTQDQYDREFECSFDAAIIGAYYAQMMAKAQSDGRIGRVAADPLLPLRAFHDIGGSGGLADAYTIWIVQFVAQEIRVIDYYESVGQVLAYHVNWMRARGYEGAINYLPHDGVESDKIMGKRYEDHWRDAGFKVEPPVRVLLAVEQAMNLEWWRGFYAGKMSDSIGRTARDEAAAIGPED